jgi:SPP1 gp7 family putative phage head morphogenesis protein
VVTANEELVDRGIRHAIHLTRLRTGVRNDILAILNDDVLPDLEATLTRRLRRFKARGFDTGPHTTKRIQDMIRVMRSEVAAGMELMDAELRAQLAELGLTEAEWQTARMNAAKPGDLAFVFESPGSRQVAAIMNSRPFEGELLKDWWSGLTSSTQDKIARQLQIGITEGETNAQIIRRLVGTGAARFEDGTFGGLRRNVSAIVQTASNHMSTQAREMTYEANADIVKGVQIVATLDTRTTEICMSEDGKVYPVGEGPRPPFHFNCRTTTVPVLRSLRELGIPVDSVAPSTRASMTGQVPAKQTYNQWLKKQPAAIQDEALGPTKGKLFRKHNLSVDSFVDDKRRVLTIDQIREMEGLD